jgi:hypothetical protein
MAGLTQSLCTSFKSELMQGLHNFAASGGNTFKIALFVGSPSGTYGSATTNYSNMGSDETSGTGYTAGGATLTNSGVSTGGVTAYTSFSNVTWTSSTISASGALIYNSTNSGKAVAVCSFGSTISTSNQTFNVTFPSNDQNNAIIRLT